jgi:hypothetical protein
MWQPDDRWPAVGECMQALRQATGFLSRRRSGTPTVHRLPQLRDGKVPS